jgi:hypothetical protein
VAQARRPLLRDPARGGACRSSAGLLTMVGVAEVGRFLVGRRDRPREVRQIARVARCPARPAMRPFARLTVVAAPLTPITRGAAHTGTSARPNRRPRTLQRAQTTRLAVLTGSQGGRESVG